MLSTATMSNLLSPSSSSTPTSTPSLHEPDIKTPKKEKCKEIVTNIMHARETVLCLKSVSLYWDFDTGAIGKQIEDGVRLMGRGAEQIQWSIHLEVSRVTVRAKEAVEAAGGSVGRVYYNKLGFRALLKPEWFEKKGRLLPKAARPPPKQKDKVDGSGRLPAPTKPIPFFTEDKELASASTRPKEQN
ncbi:54S ribosomal protein L10 [Pyrus ussuriensis x Pyrus communis]|uniref:54S ribosomal protein L10 n=1 Tax=Pyrus ussuriensis x Pyrus communis TaxID=2448454 RepID=A0A5N5F353_9ROSA|nr:54S ribosomal protein L10 [Pyrus ussuriensis x Pyrus communis]